MITCELLGGLGNQLFQIFTTISYSFDCEQPFGFSDSYETKGITNRTTYWGSFLLNFEPQTHPHLPTEWEYIKETSFQYNELPIKRDSGNKMLIGYFQSYKYFDKYFDKIYSTISMNFLKSIVKNQISDNYEKVISMHFRLGDYKKLTDYHPILPVDYYIQSLKKISENLTSGDTIESYKIIYFCEEHDNEEVEIKIKEIHSHFPRGTFVKASDSLVDWKQMILMSCCKHNIIANSSFSWWGAYFNTNIEKIVCYPKTWFGPKLSNNVLDDMFPPSWTKIDF